MLRSPLPGRSTGQRWYREINPQQWRVLAAAQLGWVLDAMDMLLYSFALTAVRAEFHVSGAMAGVLAAAPLVTSARCSARCPISTAAPARWRGQS